MCRVGTVVVQGQGRNNERTKLSERGQPSGYRGSGREDYHPDDMEVMTGNCGDSKRAL